MAFIRLRRPRPRPAPDPAPASAAGPGKPRISAVSAARLPGGRGGHTALRRRLLIALVAVFVAGPAVMLGLYRFVPPPVTPLMLIRLAEGQGLNKRWMPATAVSPQLFRAVVAAEDGTFCTHWGFDWQALDHAWARLTWDSLRGGGRVIGGSTITQQTAKNLFLWPSRTLLRKALEAWWTLGLELAWDKRRILEVYVNIVEWGPGLYGAEAAAQHYFHKPAAALSAREAALMAVVLPNPRKWSPAQPNRYVAGRAGVVLRRMGQDGPVACQE